MQFTELSLDEVEQVSGGNMVVGAVVGWVVTQTLNAAASAVQGLIQGGGAPDWGKSDVMGNMY